MAVAGRKPKSPLLKAVTGYPGGKRDKDRIAEGDGTLFEVRETALLPLKPLKKYQQELWNKYIEPAWWLNEFDVPKAYMWVCLQSEHDKGPSGMITAKLAQLRVLGSELGFDPGSRARLSVERAERKDPTQKFFD